MNLKPLFLLCISLVFAGTSRAEGTRPAAVPVGSSLEFTSSNLPIVVIDTHGARIRQDPRIPADMGIIYNGEGKRNRLTDPFNNYDGKIAIELRGSATAGYPKAPYRLETQDDQGENLNVPLIGMPSENDWILYPPYDDQSLIRNCLAYRNEARIDSRIYNRQEAKRLIKSIRFERDGTNQRLAETYRRNALSLLGR